MANFKMFYNRVCNNLEFDVITKRTGKDIDKYQKYPIIIKRRKDGTNLLTNVSTN